MTGKQGSIDDIFRLHVLGVGNYFSELCSTVSFVLQAGERFIMLEAPSEIPRKLMVYREAVKGRYLGGSLEVPGIDSLLLDNIKDFVVTHSHGDHSSGLELVAWYKMFKQQPSVMDFSAGRIVPGNRPRLYGTDAVLCDLRRVVGSGLLSSGMGSDDFFDFVTVDFGKVGSVCGVEFEPLENYHGMNGFACLFRYGGRSLAYSGDTKFDNILMEHMSSADVIVHECDASNFIHTSPVELARWADNNPAAAEKLYVCHFPDPGIPRGYGLRPLEENTFIDI